MRVGDISNNGTSDVDYATSITQHTTAGGLGAFRNGATTSTYFADFDQSYDPINGLNYEGAAARYTVQAGDTLETIAQNLWGDAAFWYLIADVNGLNGSEALDPGMSLIIPNKVHNSHNNSDTYKVYDPNEAIGDTMPTAAKPPKKAKCGTFGQVLMVAIAVAVTMIALPGAGATIGQGILAGLAGSGASQAFGLATGIQQKFDFKGLALAGIAGGVTAGLGVNGAFSKAGKGVSLSSALGIGNATIGAAVQGTVGNLVSQGIGMATGLQGKFNWAGVATAGIGAGVGNALGLGGTWGRAASGMAGGIAAAAGESLITGNSFGDTLMSSLPSIIGNTVGNLVASGIAGSGKGSEAGRPVRLAQNDAQPQMPGQSDIMYDYPPLAVTVTYEGEEQHGLGWQIADTLGFHEGGFVYNLFNGGGSSSGTFDTMGIARAASSSYDISLRRSFQSSLPTAAYDVSGGYAFTNPRVATDFNSDQVMELTLQPGFAGIAFGLSRQLGASPKTQLAIAGTVAAIDGIAAARAGMPRRLARLCTIR